MRESLLLGGLILGMACGTLGAQVPGEAQPPVPAPTPVERAAGSKVRIELVGDSLFSVGFGMGDAICKNFTAQVDCVNRGVGGTSTRTYRERGAWEPALAAKPDYMLVHFGDNDVATPGHNPREVTVPDFEVNLRGFLTEARAAGITPVLLTPLARRRFGPDGKIKSDTAPYAEVIRKIAAEMKVPLIDLQAESIALLNQMGPDSQARLSGRTRKQGAETVPDFTHLNAAGASLFGRMVDVDLAKAVPALAQYVKPQAVELAPYKVH